MKSRLLEISCHTGKVRSEVFDLAKAATSCGGSGRVVVDSVPDWLDDQLPTAWRAGLLEAVWRNPNLDFALDSTQSQNWMGRVQAVHDVIAMQNPEFGAWLSHWLDGDAPSNILMSKD